MSKSPRLGIPLWLESCSIYLFVRSSDRIARCALVRTLEADRLGLDPESDTCQLCSREILCEVSYASVSSYIKWDNNMTYLLWQSMNVCKVLRMLSDMGSRCSINVSHWNLIQNVARCMHSGSEWMIEWINIILQYLYSLNYFLSEPPLVFWDQF